eukprot:CAMPEP_0185838336 /NCGR_PEP_ID=MMETSP1353-20130828/12881_1 /TAXON_ID=1077150 /ORGANISM="Erythrolobus australicus, Strain CCMP3124" /LENGTH=187 /DNA_ID=CAMNT_0028537375 /DNA_START=159 /DNA_END=720 /DNA_ORIENTATION=-
MQRSVVARLRIMGIKQHVLGARFDAAFARCEHDVRKDLRRRGACASMCIVQFSARCANNDASTLRGACDNSLSNSIFAALAHRSSTLSTSLFAVPFFDMTRPFLILCNSASRSQTFTRARLDSIGSRIALMQLFAHLLAHFSSSSCSNRAAQHPAYFSAPTPRRIYEPPALQPDTNPALAHIATTAA